MDPNTQMGNEQMSQGAPAGDLESLMGKIDEKKNQLDMLLSIGQKKSANQKQEEVKMLFDILKSAGVDPSSQESVNKFLENLYSNNQDLYEMVVPTMEGIIGGEDVEEQEPEGEEMGEPQELIRG